MSVAGNPKEIFSLRNAVEGRRVWREKELEEEFSLRVLQGPR